jgi:hypothetical protein
VVYSLWDFDDNNAKLNVGLSGPFFLNAAEILKNSKAGWKENDILTIQANGAHRFLSNYKRFFYRGKWKLGCVDHLYTTYVLVYFTDNHVKFYRCGGTFLPGTGNSGITKYIYPNGQIQETTRDWDHVQLGIGEFAKAAKVAWTQGS